jgi:PIN domain nuclease of toxin-antitoxin system
VSRYVLDASALLALLNDEPGAGAVASALADGSIIGSVNLSEAVAILRNNDYSEAEIEVAVASVELDVPELTRSHALQAGLMIAKPGAPASHWEPGLALRWRRDSAYQRLPATATGCA